MQSRKPLFVKPGDDNLYPVKNKDGIIETFINPNVDAALTVDNDSKTNFVYNRYHHLPLESQRQKLPVFQYRNHILYLMEKYQTLILIGETGCGKSTQVPQYMYEVGHNVCVTQPRVTAAVSLACRVSEERGSTLGEIVGYAAGMISIRAPDTPIVFMTEGVLLREMFASPLLMQYSCVVLDEVHERSQMTDVLMGLLKKIARKRKNLKLIISSATMDADFLKDFFNLNKDQTNSTSVIMSMRGRTYPIDIFYVQEPVPDYVQATVDTVIKIHENEPFGDVLAFLTSQEEILSALESLQSYAQTNNQSNKSHFPSGIARSTMTVLPMYGSLPYYRQIKVFQIDRNVRKVVLATNIAETSVTIPGIVYVVDSGFHKLPQYDVSLGLELLRVCVVSRHNAVQRAGRAGRTSAGKCYRLYTEAEYDKLPVCVPPEMCRSDLTSALLRLKALGIDNLLKFTFPTPPPAKSLLSSIETLYALQAIDKQGALTPMGVVMSELPLNPMCGRMLCASAEYGCVDEILSVVSMLQVDGVFLKTGGRDAAAARISKRNNFEVAEGDVIMYLNILDAYRKIRSKYDEKKTKRASRDWCQKMYLNYRVLEKALDIRKSLEVLVKDKFQLKNKPIDGADVGSVKCINIMKAVLSGLFLNASSLSVDCYRGVKGAKLYMSSDSCLYTQQPKWVVFASVESGPNGIYMRDLMTVQREWLTEVATHYYTDT